MKVTINLPIDRPNPEAAMELLIEQVAAASSPAALCSDDPIEDAILRILAGDVNVPEEIAEAFTIYHTETKRGAVEAFLIAGATLADISEFLGVTEVVATVYQRYFFDISVLKTRLDTEDYVRQVCADTTGSYAEFHQNLLRAALDMGVEYLKSRYKDDYKIPANVALARSLRFAYVKLCESERAPAGSKLAATAGRHAKLLIDNVRSEPVVEDLQNSGRTQDQLLFELKAKEFATLTQEDPDVEELELLH